MDTDPVRESYERLATDYDRRWRMYIDASLDAALAGVDLQGDEEILDVPCGTGELERRLFAKWPRLRLTGIDVSLKMLKQARDKEVADRVRWVEADIASIPSSDQCFDFVFCVNSFHYFRTPHTALAEMHRVLCPNGKLVLVDWCDDYLSCKLCSVWLRWTDPAFYRTYSLRRCSSIVEQAGFEIEDAQRFRINWLWGLMRVVCRPVG